MAILIEVAPGELIDKLTILEIKRAHIDDPAKRRNIDHEYATLREARATAVPDSADLARLEAELKAVNQTLWRVEDEIREHERARHFGPSFIELARSVYRTNDRRAEIKRAINDLLGSRLVEEKSYTPY